MRLDYIRGPGAERCPGEQAFRDAIGAAVARDFFATSPPPLERLVVKLGRRGGGYEGTAELHDAAGAVTWRIVFPGLPHPPAGLCSSLLPALAFDIAVEVDSPARPPAPPAVAPPPPPPVVEEPPIVKPPPAPLEAPSRPFRIGVSPWLEFGAAPRAAFGLSLGLGFRVAWFSVDLEGRWDPPAASVIYGDEVRTSRVVGALVPCGHVKYFAGCLLAEVDSLWGTVTEGGINGGTQSAIYATAGGRLSAEIAIAPHLALQPAVDLLLALQRPALHVEGEARWEVPTVSGRVGVGLLASF
ncbi:MAG: hypothetical protein ACMG6S_03535 [Byssovorax sp.]